MTRRLLAPVILTALAVGCASGPESAVSELVEQVRLQDPQANATASQNEELLASAEALPFWIDAMQNDPSADVRVWAAQYLGRIGDPQAVPALTAALDGPREVRGAAASALVQIGEEEAASAFAEALATGSAESQVTLLIELEKLGAAASSAIPQIAEVARAGTAMVGQTAATTLGGIGDPAAAEPLTEIALDSNLDMEIRSAAVRSLGRLSGPEVTAGLERVVEQLEQEEGAEELHTLAQQTLQAMG